MATGTNGIATEGEAKSKLSYTGSVNSSKGCTKARAVTMGVDSTKLSRYQDTQLVKYSDIYVSTISIFCISNRSARTFRIGISRTLPESITCNVTLEDVASADTTYTLTIQANQSFSAFTAYRGERYPVAWSLNSTSPSTITINYITYKFIQGLF